MHIHPRDFETRQPAEIASADDVIIELQDRCARSAKNARRPGPAINRRAAAAGVAAVAGLVTAGDSEVDCDCAVGGVVGAIVVTVMSARRDRRGGVNALKWRRTPDSDGLSVRQ